jgi:hypothetical protein
VKAVRGRGRSRVAGVDDRYFSSLAAKRERSRRVRRLKLTTGSRQAPRGAHPEPLGDDFVSLRDGRHTVTNRARAVHRSEDLIGRDVDEEGESVDDYLARKTREFNEGTRTCPLDVALWLRFAEFQTELLALTKQRSEPNSQP